MIDHLFPPFSKPEAVAINAFHLTMMQCRREGLLGESLFNFHPGPSPVWALSRRPQTGEALPAARMPYNTLVLFLLMASSHCCPKWTCQYITGVIKTGFYFFLSTWKPIGNYHYGVAFCICKSGWKLELPHMLSIYTFFFSQKTGPHAFTRGGSRMTDSTSSRWDIFL